MPYLRHLLPALLLWAFFAIPAHASEFPDMDVCLGRQLVARILCKDPVEINYVSRVRDNIYLFSVFYANKEARFFVGVYNDIIRVQGKDFLNTTRSISYTFDKTAKCGIVDYVAPDCLADERIVCCSQKTVEEELDDQFWNRPIPELLEDDMRRALQADNATSQQDAPPENQPGDQP